MTAHATSTPVDDTQHWRQDAACAELPDVEADRIFFPNNAAYAEARVWCSNCPVVDACRDEARANREEFGFFGGETAQQRHAATRIPGGVTGKPLTDGEAVKIRQYRAAGWHVARLAAHFGRSNATLYRVLRAEGAVA